MTICSDFDGTLNNAHNPNVLKKNLQAIQTWRAHNYQFVVVTGRNHAVLKKILPHWQNQIDYIITDNGGAIFSNQDQLLYVCELPLQLIRQIKNLVCDQAVPIVYSPELCTIELMLGETAIKLRLYFRTQRQYERYQAQITAQNWPIQILPWPKPGFSKLPGGTDPSQFYGFLDIVPQVSGKENAIAQLANLVQLSSPILTIGDDDNDINMLTRYHGYAITGSQPQVLTATEGRNVNSVADLISQYL